MYFKLSFGTLYSQKWKLQIQISGFRSRRTLFCQGTLRFEKKTKYTEDDIMNMLEFLVDNIFVVFGRKVFQQIVGNPMGTNCAPLIAGIFLYSYEAEFIHSLLTTGKKKK